MYFPKDLIPNEHGMIAMGGKLNPEILIEAYVKGIFPWSKNPQIMWFSPDPRMVLVPTEFHLSHSLERFSKTHPYRVTFDTAFKEVMTSCAKTTRKDQEGTWIDSEFIEAYTAVHEQKLGHSVEIWENEQLVGGLYGLSLGKVFFGESMFSLRPNVSKLALYLLCLHLIHWEFKLIDCQAHTKHLESLGAKQIPRQAYLQLISTVLKEPQKWGPWEWLPELDPRNTP